MYNLLSIIMLGPKGLCVRKSSKYEIRTCTVALYINPKPLQSTKEIDIRDDVRDRTRDYIMCCGLSACSRSCGDRINSTSSLCCRRCDCFHLWNCASPKVGGVAPRLDGP